MDAALPLCVQPVDRNAPLNGGEATVDNTRRTPQRDNRLLAMLYAGACLTIFGACAHTPVRYAGEDAALAARSSDRVIGAEEIMAWRASPGMRDAFDLIAALRPRYLRGNIRSGTSQLQGDPPTVYVDRLRLGDASTLRFISPSEISYIRFFTAVEARSEWGDGHPGGVIQVVRRSEVAPLGRG